MVGEVLSLVSAVVDMHENIGVRFPDPGVNTEDVVVAFGFQEDLL